MSSFASTITVKTNYISTGVDGFDKAIGGGLVAGCPILLGGQHGVGKSTLLCMIADAVTRKKGPVLYASGEQGDDGVVKIASRLGIVNDDVKVLGDQCSVEKVIEQAMEGVVIARPGEPMKRVRPFLVIYDSIQKFASETAGGVPGSGAQLRAVGGAILAHCRATKTCAIIINQMDKQGEMKGSTDAAHDVDTVLVFGYPRSDDDEAPGQEEDGYRVLTCAGKNRNGPENAKTYWLMTAEGKLEHVAPRSKVITLSRRRRRGDEDGQEV